MTEKPNASAKIIRQIRVRQTSNPKIGVLELRAGDATELYAVSRQAMIDIANHLLKNADRIEGDETAVGLPN